MECIVPIIKLLAQAIESWPKAHIQYIHIIKDTLKILKYPISYSIIFKKKLLKLRNFKKRKSVNLSNTGKLN